MESQPKVGDNGENKDNGAMVDAETYFNTSNENAIKFLTTANNIGIKRSWDEMTPEERSKVMTKIAAGDNGKNSHEKIKIPANFAKVGAAVGGVAVLLTGLQGLSYLAGKKDQNKDAKTYNNNPHGPSIVEGGSSPWATNPSVYTPYEVASAQNPEANENKEEKEKFRYTNEHKYYFEEEKLEGKKNDKGVIPTAFARAELLTHDSYFDDLTPEERTLIEKGDKKAEGYEAAMKKLFAESILRECKDSYEVAGSFFYTVEQAKPGTFEDYKDKSAQEIVDSLYKEDDETKTKNLKKFYDLVYNSDQTEEKVKGKFDNWDEVDVRKENPDRAVKLRPLDSEYDGMWLTRVDLPDGGTFWVRLLVRNAGREFDTNTKEAKFISRTPDGKIYYGCGQPLLRDGGRDRGPSTPDPKHPPKKPTPTPSGSKNAAAIKRNAGSYNEKQGSGKKTDRPQEGGNQGGGGSSDSGAEKAISGADKTHKEDVHKGNNPDKRTADNNAGQNKANKDADNNRDKAKANETISNKDAAKKLGFQ